MSKFSYEGKRVVVSGGGGAGMGAATVVGLAEMGAEIHVLDLKDPPIEVASHQVVDLRDPTRRRRRSSRSAGASTRCSTAPGLPGRAVLGPRRDARELRRAAAPHVAGRAAHDERRGGGEHLVDGGQRVPADHREVAALVETPDFAAAKAWCEAHPEEIVGAYGQSKEALIIWTMHAAPDLAAQGIRLNCISPGPTDTPMMPAFESYGGPKIIDLFAQCLGRRSTPEEQAWPMIFLNSDAASYITGENVNTDGGTIAGMATGKIVIDVAAALAGDA